MNAYHVKMKNLKILPGKQMKKDLKIILELEAQNIKHTDKMNAIEKSRLYIM